MIRQDALIRLLAGAAALCAFSTPAPARDIAGVACASPPPLHCSGADCAGPLINEPGNAVDAKTGRKFFLDYPCDLKPNEKVVFILSLHGGGSIANWQRHYFPIMDLKEKYRLVIATPSGTANGWNPAKDDEHLHNIVEMVEAQFGRGNIKAFWLAGHSLGGQTANRLLLTDFFRSRLTGWVSLSGGRLGSKREDVRAAIPTGSGGPNGAPPPPRPAPAPGAAPLGLVADASVLPPYPFSFIYSTGEHELTPAGLPKTSPWAQKLKCGPQTRGPVIIDARGGYVYDSRPQANPNPVWGFKARPGKAQVYLYPNCAGGRVVADIVRMDKGHTEGFEPAITEQIVKLMLAAK